MRPAAATRRIALGLIGDNVAASRAPALHRAAGALAGLEVAYDLFAPPALGRSFAETLAACRAAGLAGVNVTMPYKAEAAALVETPDPEVTRIGAVNTVLFGDGAPRGYNTDWSGFVAAWRAAFADRPPGRVVLFGAGGVGRAVATGLAGLGAAEIAIVDPDAHRAADLARRVGAGARAAGLEALADVDGVVNCTPLGMHGHPGSPVPDGAFPPAAWAFDAVYTPTATPFRAQAEDAGARFLSGYELFLHQGLHAFRLFTGALVDAAALRSRLG